MKRLCDSLTLCRHLVRHLVRRLTAGPVTGVVVMVMSCLPAVTHCDGLDRSSLAGGDYLPVLEVQTVSVTGSNSLKLVFSAALDQSSVTLDSFNLVMPSGDQATVTGASVDLFDPAGLELAVTSLNQNGSYRLRVKNIVSTDLVRPLSEPGQVVTFKLTGGSTADEDTATLLGPADGAEVKTGSHLSWLAPNHETVLLKFYHPRTLEKLTEYQVDNDTNEPEWPISADLLSELQTDSFYWSVTTPGDDGPVESTQRLVHITYADSVYVSEAAAGNAYFTGNRAFPLTSIDEAFVRAAGKSGVTIYVAAGTYLERLRVEGTLSFRGGYNPADWQQDPENYPTIIKGTGGEALWLLDTSSGLVEGFEFTPTDNAIATVIIDGGNAVIKDCVVDSGDYSTVGLTAVNYNGQIESCHFQFDADKNFTGMKLQSSTVEISHSSFQVNEGDIVIDADQSSLHLDRNTYRATADRHNFSSDEIGMLKCRDGDLKMTGNAVYIDNHFFAYNGIQLGGLALDNCDGLVVNNSFVFAYGELFSISGSSLVTAVNNIFVATDDLPDKVKTVFSDTAGVYSLENNAFVSHGSSNFEALPAYNDLTFELLTGWAAGEDKARGNFFHQGTVFTDAPGGNYSFDDTALTDPAVRSNLYYGGKDTSQAACGASAGGAVTGAGSESCGEVSHDMQGILRSTGIDPSAGVTNDVCPGGSAALPCSGSATAATADGFSLGALEQSF